MEVHAHTHTERKKWTHYFWEFLMLFLAVFAGFLAENQREHMIEHQRAKVYATNLYEELKKDTASLNAVITNNILTYNKLDSFCLYSTEKEKRTITNGMLYYYGRFTTWVNFFSSNNTTIGELEGSGNLRIMSNIVSQKISGYSKKISELENEYQLSKNEFVKIEELYFKIFDGYTSIQLIPSNIGENVNRDSVFKLNPPLINDDPKLMKEFVGWLKFETYIYKMQNDKHHIPLKQATVELMFSLKKEYRLE